jgi:2-acylglycerol O-acyltransferase 2
MKILGVNLAPLNVPLERRLQTLSILYFEFIFLQGVSLIGLTTIIYVLFYTKYYWFSIVYMIWYLADMTRCHRGGRGFQFARKWTIWKYFCNYFPLKLIKTADLDGNKNYLFGVHPHGVMAYSAFGNFGTEGSGFSKLFPNLKPHLLVLKEQFFAPFQREFVMMSGACAASEQGLKYILNNKGQCKQKGQMCALLVGGAAESLNAFPGKYKLVLKNRKGFIRIALETGSSLVPVFCFGENDLFSAIENPKNSILRKIQEKLKTWSHFGFPIFWGRGIFNYTFGILPRRIPLNTVVGKPIEVQKNILPTKQEIDRLHELYINELIKLFEENKEKYSIDKSVQLEIE